MVYFNGDTSTTPIYEGIDKIKLILQPHLYAYLDFTKIYRNNIKRHERWIDTRNKHLNLYVKDTKYNCYIYFIIHGEYIDHNRNIKETIIDALYSLIKNRVIMLDDYLRNQEELSKKFTKIPGFYAAIDRTFIRDNLYLIMQKVREMELYFDLDSGSIGIGNSDYVFKHDAPTFRANLRHFQKSKEYTTKTAIIVINGTIYSKDYHYKRRLSTIKIYNRKNKLLKGNHSYKEKEINTFPYDTRMEVLITNINSGNRLNIENLNGTYSDIMYRYIPLLEVYFTKFIPHFTFINIFHLFYLPILYDKVKINPHKKYKGYNLLTVKRKYPDKNKSLRNGFLFQTILNKESRRLRVQYLLQMKQIIKIMGRDIKMDVNSMCFYSIFDKYTDDTDDNILILGDEYMPIKLNNQDY